MKQSFLALGLGFAIIAAVAPGQAMARGTIEKACLRADRPAATRALCGCIQSVADATLNSSDQRRGAKLFAEPEESQAVKMSNRRADELFWAKWERFADGAVKYCQ